MATIIVTDLTSLAVEIPAPIEGYRRTFTVRHQSGNYIRRFANHDGGDPKDNLGPTRLGDGLYAHYELVPTPGEATEFLDRRGAGMLHGELPNPGFSKIVTIDTKLEADSQSR